MDEESPGLAASPAPGLTGGLKSSPEVPGYRLEEQIGRGGMAVVFRAVDERLDRRVALKILSPVLAADEAFRNRFIRESRTAAAVDDPHIIPVFAAGDADGILYIAMRYVPGGDVKTLLRNERRLPAARAAVIISAVASALDAAHAAGLVHRDVKPANMLLDTRAGRADHVYLSDFGLSKAWQGSTGLTGSGQFLGTVDYASPEQIEGRPVDGRSDQYSLACAAFELLAGEPPFRRDDGLAVMYAHMSTPPPSLTHRVNGLAPAVDEVFARGLAKAPADRYASCGDFAQALRLALGLAAHGGVDSPPGRTPTVAASSGPAAAGSQPGSGQPGGPPATAWDGGGGPTETRAPAAVPAGQGPGPMTVPMTELAWTAPLTGPAAASSPTPATGLPAASLPTPPTGPAAAGPPAAGQATATPPGPGADLPGPPAAGPGQGKPQGGRGRAGVLVAAAAAVLLVAAGIGIALLASSHTPPAPRAAGTPAPSGHITGPALPPQQVRVCTVPAATCIASQPRSMKAAPAEMYTAGDGSSFLTNLEWVSWGSPAARATGILEVNNCKPDCAQGTYTWHSATVTVTRLTPYGNGKEAYAHLVVTAPGAPVETLTFSSGLVP